MKTCPRCQVEKPLAEYSADSKMADGKFYVCKSCDGDQKREYRYGITREQYDALMAYQGGVCAICRKPGTPKRALALDHVHVKPRYVRGLLCVTCNRHIIGRRRGEEGALLLARAADYLRNPPGRVVLPAHEVSDVQHRRAKKPGVPDRHYL